MSQYLLAVIANQSVNSSFPLSALNHFAPIINQWANGHLVQVKLSGSNAKNTAVKLCVDVDIFISLSQNLSMTLNDIYNNLFTFFDQGTYNPRKQNVSVRVNYGSGMVDLVPAQKQNTHSNDHSLFVKKRNSWTKTNVDTHVNTVIQAGKSNLIKLLKIWRERHGLEFPSLYLELAAIRSLQGQYFYDLEKEFRYVLGWLALNIENARFIDPSNTNNILSDDLTIAEKLAIKQRASIGVLTQDITKVVW